LGRNRAFLVPCSRELQCCLTVAAREGSVSTGRLIALAPAMAVQGQLWLEGNGVHPLPPCPSLIGLTMSSPETVSARFVCQQFKITIQPNEAQRTCASSCLLCLLVMAKAFKSSINNNNKNKTKEDCGREKANI